MKSSVKYIFIFLFYSWGILLGQNQVLINSFHVNGYSNIPKYGQFEVGVKLPQTIQQEIDNFLEGISGVNPYDPSQIEVITSYTSKSSGKTFKRNGFYFKEFEVSNSSWVLKKTDFTFRIRFAPPENGLYECKIALSVGQKLISVSEFTFSVVNSSHPGHLTLANGDLRKMQHENGNMFFGIGQNIGYVVDAQSLGISRPTSCLQWYCRPPGSYDMYRSFINDVADNKGNFVRLRLTPFDFPIEWPEWKMYSTDPEPKKSLIESINNYDHNQHFMWEFDKVVSLCEERNIYAMLNILSDGSWSTKITPGDGEDFGWKKNPYSALLGADLGGLKRFFSDPAAKKYYKSFLYYIQARWGYSSNLGIWELINETEHIEGYQTDTEFAKKISDWICEMKSYMETFYPWHPVTNGSIGSWDQPNCLNIWSKNSYHSSITDCKYDNGNYNQRAKNQYDYNDRFRPFIWGELGTDPLVDENIDREFHNTLWSTTMMGGIATGMYWWDFRQGKGVNHRQNFNSLSEFCKRIDWTQVLMAGKDFSEGDVTCRSNKQKKKIYSFWQRNKAANFACGWAVNASSTWYSDVNEYIVPEDFSKASAAYPCIPSPNPYDIPSNSCHPQIHIKGLLPLTKYDIDIYDTYDISNKLLESLTESTDFSGNLKFRRQFTFEIKEPFYPDYAFIVRTKESNHGRIRIYPNPADDIVSFELLDENVPEFTVRIYNELGQLLLIQSNSKSISVAQLVDGFYILQVLYGGKDKTAKLIISH